MALKYHDRIKAYDIDEKCINEKMCSRFFSYHGECLYKDSKTGRCMIADIDEKAGLSPAGGIL